VDDDGVMVGIEGAGMAGMGLDVGADLIEGDGTES